MGFPLEEDAVSVELMDTTDVVTIRENQESAVNENVPATLPELDQLDCDKMFEVRQTIHLFLTQKSSLQGNLEILY